MPGDPWPHSSRFNLYRSTQDSIQKPKSPQITPPSHIHLSPSVLSNHSSSSIFFNSISITSECFLFKRLLNPRSQGMKGFINPRVPRSIQITESLERCGPYWQASQTGECGFQALLDLLLEDIKINTIQNVEGSDLLLYTGDRSSQIISAGRLSGPRGPFPLVYIYIYVCIFMWVSFSSKRA